MAYLNKVQFIGFVGNDAQFNEKRTGKGKDKKTTVYSRFSIAVSENSNSPAEWFTITTFGPLAEFTRKRVKKGALVFVECRIQNKKWTDKDGNDQYGFSFIANNVQICSKLTAEQPEQDMEE